MSTFTRSALRQQHTRLSVLEHQRTRSANAPAPSPTPPQRLVRAGAPLSGQMAFTRKVARHAFDRLSVDLKEPTALEARATSTSRRMLEQNIHERSPSPSYKLPRPIRAQGTSQAERVRVQRLDAKRAKARKRQSQFGRRLRRSVSLPGVLETISLGKSEKDYRRRFEALIGFASQMQLELRPADRLDSTLCEYSDH